MASSNEQSTHLVEISRPAQCEVIFSDGVSQIILGFPNSRLVFADRTELERAEDGKIIKEIRHARIEMVLPTPAMIEMARQILKQTDSQIEALQNLANHWAEEMQNMAGLKPAE